MKTIYIYILIFLFALNVGAQEISDNLLLVNDSIPVQNLNQVEISAFRTKILLLQIPSSVSVVTNEQLTSYGSTIAANDALRLVTGVRIDNGTGGSRVHLYMRGQGILTESGFRGIAVLIDGIPVNDPGGFCPDLYDVEWVTVKNVEVVKGPAASLYGTSGIGGVVNINTMDGGSKPTNGLLYASAGSYGFWKILGQVDGNQNNLNYRVSFSHTQGDGYRNHQAFMGDIFNEKATWTPSNKVTITQILSYTKYFNQNSEGINLGRYDTVGPRAANTDAVPYNEFHKTQRLTGAIIGNYIIKNNQSLRFTAFMRMNEYRETSNNGDDYKPFSNPGISAQYNLKFGNENLKNLVSLGADYESKNMNEHMFGVEPDPDRIDTPFGESCIDTDTILINQIIKQRAAGIFLFDQLNIGGKLFLTLNARYDKVYNELINNVPLPDSVVQPSGNRTFENPSISFGASFNVSRYLNVYANYGTGFLVPTGDELYNNPAHYGGFNEEIVPTFSQGVELGARGNVKEKLEYNLAGFYIVSDNEFYRYSIPGRGNNTAFYGNVGGSKKYGIETYLSWSPIKFLQFDVAYTYSHFQYSSPDSVSGHWMPQCPQHILTVEASIDFLKHFNLTLSTQYVSKWFIQTDDSIYMHYTENGIVRNSWVNGYNVYGANLSYQFNFLKLDGELSLFAKNIFDEHYFGFTEPNDSPDYNSYQPAAGREFFLNLKLRF